MFRLLGTLTFITLLAGCSSGLEINGEYTSNFDTTETIDSEHWLTVGMGYMTEVHVIEFDNDTNIVVTQNPASDMFAPSKFNKIEWTEISGTSFHYCIVDFGRVDAMAAKTSTHTADRTSPDTAGCNGFGWTKLTKK